MDAPLILSDVPLTLDTHLFSAEERQAEVAR